MAGTEVASLTSGLPGPLSPSLPGTARETDRRTERQTDRSASLSGHHTGDGQMDRRTERSASLSRRHLGDRWTDRALRVGAAGQTDRQTAPCPASSRPHIVCPQAPSCGRCSLEELEWEGSHSLALEPSCVGSAWLCQRGSAHGLALLAPSDTPVTPLCLRGINTTSRPCAADERSKCGGIYFNRWRTIFFSSFTRRTSLQSLGLWCGATGALLSPSLAAPTVPAEQPFPIATLGCGIKPGGFRAAGCAAFIGFVCHVT